MDSSARVSTALLKERSILDLVKRTSNQHLNSQGWKRTSVSFNTLKFNS